MLNMNDSLDFKVNINNFSGSLEVLLDLAKSQKVDLETISITKLADQFLEFIKNTENVNLELASEYLLMATWLTYLKSKLLLPESEEEELEKKLSMTIYDRNLNCFLLIFHQRKKCVP